MTLILTACAVLFALPMGAIVLSSWLADRQYRSYKALQIQWAQVWLTVCVAIGMGIGWVVTR